MNIALGGLCNVSTTLSSLLVQPEERNIAKHGALIGSPGANFSWPTTYANWSLGGGFWQPEASALAKLRRDIDRKPHKIKRVLLDDGIRTEFLGNVSSSEKKAVKAFVNSPTNRSSALKRHPKVCPCNPLASITCSRFWIAKGTGDKRDYCRPIYRAGPSGVDKGDTSIGSSSFSWCGTVGCEKFIPLLTFPHTATTLRPACLSPHSCDEI